MQIIMGRIGNCQPCAERRSPTALPGAYQSQHGVTYCANCAPPAVKSAPAVVAVNRAYAEAAALKVGKLIAGNVASMRRRRRGTTSEDWTDQVTAVTLAQLKALDPRLWAAAGVGMMLDAEAR